MLTPLKKLPKNGKWFGQINCCQRLCKIQKVQKTSQSGHTAHHWQSYHHPGPKKFSFHFWESYLKRMTIKQKRPRMTHFENFSFCAFCAAEECIGAISTNDAKKVIFQVITRKRSNDEMEENKDGVWHNSDDHSDQIGLLLLKSLGSIFSIKIIPKFWAPFCAILKTSSFI